MTTTLRICADSAFSKQRLHDANASALLSLVLLLDHALRNRLGFPPANDTLNNPLSCSLYDRVGAGKKKHEVGVALDVLLVVSPSSTDRVQCLYRL